VSEPGPLAPESACAIQRHDWLTVIVDRADYHYAIIRVWRVVSVGAGVCKIISGRLNNEGAGGRRAKRSDIGFDIAGVRRGEACSRTPIDGEIHHAGYAAKVGRDLARNIV
jgi:hypothetical protein